MLRQLFNATLAGIALVVLAMPILIIASLIKLTSPGPALFRQRRVGKLGREFSILKFRTMTVSASQQSLITVGDDNRITAVGSFLRKTKLDELPQLVNVVKRDMNLVGPRPELPEFVRKYSDYNRMVVLSVEPGLTDFASLRYRRESDLLAAAQKPLDFYERVLVPRKLRYARFYVRRAGILLDLYVICLTIRILIEDMFGRAAIVPPASAPRPRSEGLRRRVVRAR